MDFSKRTWAEISLDNITHNVFEIRKIVGSDVAVIWIVKADSYGHGAVPVCHKLEAIGADYFAVAAVDEAQSLRQNGIKTPILVLSSSSHGMIDEIIANDITPSVLSWEDAQYLSEEAVKRNKIIKVHIAIDTGMGRIGLNAREESALKTTIDYVLNIARLPGIQTEGIFTHFATADEEDNTFTRKQYTLFSKVIDAVKDKAPLVDSLKYIHCANSAAIIKPLDMHINAVRAGIILYGMHPSEYTKQYNINLKPAMTLKTAVTFVKQTETSTPISYGSTYVTQEGSYIATVPVGYADGYRRSLSNNAHMILHGRKVPVIGRVCMDQTMLDVTELFKDGITVKTGDVVEIFGEGIITADDVARNAGTINYDITCGISMRVPRIYIEKGKQDVVVNLLSK